MKKIAIIYASTHHGNTKKLVEAISQKFAATLIDTTQHIHADLTDYDLIGFASGIEFGKFYDSVEQFLIDNLPKNKQVFFLYTCAMAKDNFTKSVRSEAQKRDAVILGEYGCRGFNTYGPWKLVGGMNKGHPTEDEIAGAVHFIGNLLNP